MDSLNTILTDRVLWYDGKSAFNPARLKDLISSYDVKYVTQDADDVKTYNRHVSKVDEITVKSSCDALTTDWNIPREYKELDVLQYLAAKHVDITEGMSDDEAEARERRLVNELLRYKEFGLMDVLRTITWVINTLTVNDVVWGVGRGSSVSSYVLYVIGVHDVDSYAYDLDVDDFLHP